MHSRLPAGRIAPSTSVPFSMNPALHAGAARGELPVIIDQNFRLPRFPILRDPVGAGAAAAGVATGFCVAGGTTEKGITPGATLGAGAALGAAALAAGTVRPGDVLEFSINFGLICYLNGRPDKVPARPRSCIGCAETPCFQRNNLIPYYLRRAVRSGWWRQILEPALICANSAPRWLGLCKARGARQRTPPSIHRRQTPAPPSRGKAVTPCRRIPTRPAARTPSACIAACAG